MQSSTQQQQQFNAFSCLSGRLDMCHERAKEDLLCFALTFQVEPSPLDAVRPSCCSAESPLAAGTQCTELVDSDVG